MGSSEDKETVNKFSLDERRRALRKFRKKAGLSQSDLGKMAGLSFSAISRFERGSRDLSPEAFARVSNAVAEVLSGKRLLQRERQEANRLNALRESREAKQLGVPLKTLLGASPESFDAAESAARKQIAESPTLFRDIADLGGQIALLKKIVASSERIIASQDRIIREALAQLENASLDDPVIAEIIASLRREIAALEEQLAVQKQFQSERAGNEQ